LSASQRDFLHFTLFGNILHRHQQICIFDILFEFFNRFALGHDVGMFKELAQPESIPFPVN